jgi:hypothetical protein
MNFAEQFNPTIKTMNTFAKIFSGGTGALIILAAIFSAGCKSTDKPESASFAAVVIPNKTVDQIREAAVAVFRQNGYTALTLGDGTTGFEREANSREQRQYAGFVGAHEGDKVVIRVTIKIEPKNPGADWLSCKASAVTNPGQGVFETTSALFGFQSDPYQKLLNQVAAKLAFANPMP